MPATGAYTLGMASNYNGVPRPAAVLVGGGAARLIVRRETVDDLLAREPRTRADCFDIVAVRVEQEGGAVTPARVRAVLALGHRGVLLSANPAAIPFAAWKASTCSRDSATKARGEPYPSGLVLDDDEVREPCAAPLRQIGGDPEDAEERSS